MIDIEQAKTFWPPSRHERWMSKDFESHLVSVIIPTFNRAALLGKTMDSVWRQTYRPIEMIVVDDGSTDSTEMAIKQWRRQHHDGGFTLRY